MKSWNSKSASIASMASTLDWPLSLHPFTSLDATFVTLVYTSLILLDTCFVSPFLGPFPPKEIFMKIQKGRQASRVLVLFLNLLWLTQCDWPQ